MTQRGMLTTCFLVLVLNATSPALADKYAFKEASFESALISQCLILAFYDSFDEDVNIESLRPDDADCTRALLPCHVRHGVPLDRDLDLAELPRDTRHQMSHCLNQHVEEAEILAFQQVTRRIAEPSEFKTRTTIRSWLTTMRGRYLRCADRFEKTDINRVNCTLDAVIEYAADVDVANDYKRKLWELREAK